MSGAHKKSRTVLVTGSAGFIGYSISKKLLEDGWKVIGIDSLSDYYDVSLKMDRENILSKYVNFKAVRGSIEQPGLIRSLFLDERPTMVLHLAAQAGVRNSISHPRSYLQSNIIGTFEILEAAREYPPQHLLMASTSSVYGANEELPYHENHKADHPMSFYSASKKSTEIIAHSYSHLFEIPITMFRFFTVYGPWGRPDMALFKFTKAILAENTIDVFNKGIMERDFTYIADLVKAVTLLMEVKPQTPRDRGKAVIGDSISPVAAFRIVNIGNSKPVKLGEFIKEIEKVIGRISKKNMLPMQAGDVPATSANSDLLKALTGYRPDTSLNKGVNAFIDWYREYYKV